ncbi:VOC family protein [Rubripirellula reticaptiva]|uniref:Glyoxalase-like domain protein n=1 Tax=Rubripirellula reticaptiva TaxID=2528013 RepID=A0A5C6EVB2_9BACT|nr:VOC family protein [Rubripirellula reticaptiva]TWU51576.1 Glyoxalase-like domain protein [Rubripirellula reticaptiva]
MNKHEKINYIEFPSRNLAVTKTFFAKCFGWTFTDYGQEYTAFEGSGLDGGFFKADLAASPDDGSALIVQHSEDIEQTFDKVQLNGGTICKPMFTFPGGRRFHFTEPTGNELAAWTDK